jgi:hypothetical protein
MAVVVVVLAIKTKNKGKKSHRLIEQIASSFRPQLRNVRKLNITAGHL